MFIAALNSTSSTVFHVVYREFHYDFLLVSHELNKSDLSTGTCHLLTYVSHGQVQNWAYKCNTPTVLVPFHLIFCNI
jgi:hypothetical protein